MIILDTYLKEFAKQINVAIADRTRIVSEVGVESLEMYYRELGMLEGLRYAMYVSEEISKRLLINDDDDEDDNE